jgi:hypothetical protein
MCAPGHARRRLVSGPALGGRWAFTDKLSGTLEGEGDGDWAKESLALGCPVYRVWSRPWLVTK